MFPPIYKNYVILGLTCGNITEERRTFDDLDELYTVADDLPEAYRGGLQAHDPRTEESGLIKHRDSVWLDDEPRVVGDVPRKDAGYNLIQYGDILTEVGDGIQKEDEPVEVEGYAVLSQGGRRMSALVTFPGYRDIGPREDETIDIGLKVRSGHATDDDVRFDISGRHEDGHELIAFDTSISYSQSHERPLKWRLAQSAVQHVLRTPEDVARTLEKAHNQEIISIDHALQSRRDTDINHYFDDTTDTAQDAIMRETATQPRSRYDIYNAAARALHNTDLPRHRIDQGVEEAVSVL